MSETVAVILFGYGVMVVLCALLSFAFWRAAKMYPSAGVPGEDVFFAWMTILSPVWPVVFLCAIFILIRRIFRTGGPVLREFIGDLKGVK